MGTSTLGAMGEVCVLLLLFLPTPWVCMCVAMCVEPLHEARCAPTSSSSSIIIICMLVSISVAFRKDGMPFVGPKKGVVLQALVQQHAPRRALEVGTLCGYSAILLAQVRAVTSVTSLGGYNLCCRRCLLVPSLLA